MIEEHRYDENGTEIYTFGVEDVTGIEDDQMPVDKSEKKKKTKKEKKKKKKKSQNQEQEVITN